MNLSWRCSRKSTGLGAREPGWRPSKPQYKNTLCTQEGLFDYKRVCLKGALTPDNPNDCSFLTHIKCTTFHTYLQFCNFFQTPHRQNKTKPKPFISTTNSWGLMKQSSKLDRLARPGSGSVHPHRDFPLQQYCTDPELCYLLPFTLMFQDLAVHSISPCRHNSEKFHDILTFSTQSQHLACGPILRLSCCLFGN